MYRPTLSLATVTLLTHFTVLTAQEPPPIEVGQRVRVTAPDCGVRMQVTTSEAFRGDTLILDTTKCPLASVTRLDVQRGRKSYAVTGALVGALVGTVGGGFVSNTLVQLNREASVDELVGVTIVGVTLGCVLGTSVGTIIGSHFMIDLWEEVPLDRFRVNFASRRDERFNLGFTFAF